MMTLLLILLTISSFILYGVVGQDKSFLLGPVFVLAYVAISMSLLKKSAQLSAVCLKPEKLHASGIKVSSFKFPVSTTLWLLFLVWGIVLVPAAVMPFDAKIRMLFFGAVIGSYLVWGQQLTAFKDSRLVLGGLIFIVMLIALYGLVVHIKSPDSILWSVRYTDHYDGRLASTYICPNHFAHLMQMLLPFCLALLFIPQAGIYLKILAGYSFLIFMPPLFLTESRAGWLGSMAAIGVVICLMALRRSKKLFTLLVILVPLCSMLLLFGAWRYSETFQRRMTPVVQFLKAQSSGGIGSDSPDFRPLTWRDTLDMIAASPMTGYGPGTFRYAYPEFRTRYKGNQIVTGHPHNEYLELTAEFGVIGFGLFALAWIYGSLWLLIKSLRAEETRHAFIGFAFLGTVAGTMVHSFFDFEMHVFPNAMIFALLAAVSVGPLRRAKQVEKREDKQTEEGRRTSEDGGQSVHRSLSEVGRAAIPDQGPGTKGRDRRRGTGHQAPVAHKTLYLKLKTLLFWLLTFTFLGAAAVGLQTMASSIFRDGADRMLEVMPVSLDDMERAEAGYRRSVKIDSSNWRAYQGMGKLIHDKRRHCLDKPEKEQWALAEQSWYEQALRHNPKDPESLIGLGRCLLFLSRQRTESDLTGAVPAREEGPRTPNAELQTPNREAAGLNLLREACRYRKFNDQYWWILGVELRKSGHYAEALSVFQQMETVKRTPSSRKNIQWLEKQLAGMSEQRPEGQDRSTQDPGPKTGDLLNQLDAEHETDSGTLENLFQLMEP